MMIHVKRRVAAALVLTAAAATAAGLAASSAATATAATKKPTSKCASYGTLRTGYNISAGYMAPIIAQADGYLLPYCLQIQEQPISGAAVLLAEVESGSADMALLNPAGIVQAVQSGIALKIIAPDDGGGGDMPECTAANSGITSMNQLEGKSVATTLLHSANDVAVRIVLARDKVNVANNHVHFVQLPNASIVPDIVNGTVAAGACPEPAETENAQSLRIIDTNPFTQVFGPNAPTAYAVTTAAFAAAHPAIVKEYQEGYLALANAIQKNEDIFRSGFGNFANLPASVYSVMHVPTLPTTYAFSSFALEMKALKDYGAIATLPTTAQLKALFVPLPTTTK